MPRQPALVKIDRGHHRPKTKRKRMVRSDSRCCRTRHSRSGEAVNCPHRSYWYRVNHVTMPLCVCCATYMSRRKGVRVIPV